MSNIKGKAWIIITFALALFVITGSVVLIVRLSTNQPREITLTESNPVQYGWKIYVDGAVKSPGCYALSENDTFITIINTSGLTDEADTNSIKLYIPKNVDTNEPQKVSLNRADAWLIAALPGIGNEKAKAIVEFRNQNGPYSRIEDLLKVKGIGKTIIDNIRQLVTLTE
jgi:competence protein ComEA